MDCHATSSCSGLLLRQLVASLDNYSCSCLGKIYKYNHFRNLMYINICLIKYEENLRMDWEILKNIKFRDQFFIKHQFLASLSICLFILSICEIEPSGSFLGGAFSIRHSCCVQLLQNWNQTLTDNRCYLKQYIAQRMEMSYIWFGGLLTQPVNYFYCPIGIYTCWWQMGLQF